MSSNDSSNGDAISAVFESLANLEKDFASIELDALRRKEHALIPLYEKRQKLINQIPTFWPSVLLNGPEELQSVLSPIDTAVLAAVKSLSIDRYQIKSETEGEPRSLRFTFEFDDNDLFEDKNVVKDFVYKPREEGYGNLVSKPVSFKWKKAGKKTGMNKLLDLAVDLHSAEDALAGGKPIDNAEREGLWQYEKLREALEKEEEENSEPTFAHWFAYRGAVADPVEGTKKNGDADEDDEDDEEDDGMLNVEIFPAGEEVAIALAEDLWPNVMDYFIASQSEDMSDVDEFDEEDLDDDDAPELIEVEVPDEPETAPQRPSKRQKKA